MFTTLSVLATILFVAAILVARKPVSGSSKDSLESDSGKVINWQLGENKQTEILSNKALGLRQQLIQKGGILKKGDVVCVWAEEFLDHDILYPTVLSNIIDGIKYVYILHVRHAERFGQLDRSLRQDIPKEDHHLLKTGIDVLFVRNGLTLNNFVSMAPQTSREQMYSSLIFSRRPVGWIRQSTYRANVFTQRIQHLLAAAAIAQHSNPSWRQQRGQAPAYSERIFELGDQEMDFSSIVTNAGIKSARHPADFQFLISKIIAETVLDEGAGFRAEETGKNYLQLVEGGLEKASSD